MKKGLWILGCIVGGATAVVLGIMWIGSTIQNKSLTSENNNLRNENNQTTQENNNLRQQNASVVQENRELKNQIAQLPTKPESTDQNT